MVAAMLTGAQPRNHCRGGTLPLRISGSGAAAAVCMLLLLLLVPTKASAAVTAGGPAAGSGSWPWPLKGEVITPYKNGTDPYAAGQHRGLDIATGTGTPVLAVLDGRISFSGRLPDGGLTVTLASSDGRWLISHLHLSRRDVTKGERVRAGQPLGLVGVSGRRSAEAPHLHFGVREAGSRAYVDPLSLLGAMRLPQLVRPTAPARPAAGSRAGAARGQTRAARQARPATRASNTLAAAASAGARPSLAARPARSTTRRRPAAKRVSLAAPPPLRRSSSGSARTATQAQLPGATVATAEPAAQAALPSTRATETSRRRLPPRLMLVIFALICAAALLRQLGPAPSCVGSPPAASAAGPGARGRVATAAGSAAAPETATETAAEVIELPRRTGTG